MHVLRLINAYEIITPISFLCEDGAYKVFLQQVHLPRVYLITAKTPKLRKETQRRTKLRKDGQRRAKTCKDTQRQPTNV